MIISDTLFSLLRLSLGNQAESIDLSDLKKEDWQGLIDLSFDQGVAAIAVDGFHKICEASPTVEFSLDNEEMDEVKYEWLGEVFAREDDYRQQMEAIHSLVGLWTKNGLSTYALKGVAFAQYYPVPEHRYCCDFDCNVRSTDGNLPAWALADRLARENGIDVDASMNKHSRYIVRDLSVENHRHVIGVNGSGKDKRFDEYLQGLLCASGESLLPDVALYSPCWLFNALFCVAHAQVHLLCEEGISLRHVLDWVQIRKAPEAGRWRGQLESDIDRFGLRKFFDALDGVADYVMGESDTLTRPGRLLLEDILAPKDVQHFKSRFLAHLNILRMLWKNRWKFRLYSDTSTLATMCRYVYGHFFDRDN